MIKPDRRAQEAQAPESGERAVAEQRLVAATELLVGFQAATRIIQPYLFLDRDNEDGAPLAIEDDQEDDEVDRVLGTVVIYGVLRRHEKRERVAEAVVEEPVVRPVEVILQGPALVAADLEDIDQTSGPGFVGGEWHSWRRNFNH